MASRTGISWTDATYNPWRGCTKVSAGCRNCYMFREQRRFGREPSVVVRAAAATFAAPLRWREPRRIFVCSWSDFFHEAADAWRAEALDVMRRAPQHTYQVLTKRPERFGVVRPEEWPPRLWLGVSVEDQAAADARIPRLLQALVSLRWVSIEPMLGAVDLTALRVKVDGHSEQWNALDAEYDDNLAGPGPKLSWVVVGGESGPRARPLEVAWLRDVRDQCRAAGVPCFVKQDSGPRPGMQGQIPDDLWRVKEWPRLGGDL